MKKRGNKMKQIKAELEKGKDGKEYLVVKEENNETDKRK